MSDKEEEVEVRIEELGGNRERGDSSLQPLASSP
jgi:hypothetical protein